TNAPFLFGAVEKTTRTLVGGGCGDDDDSGVGAVVAARRRWLLTHGIQLALLKCLKSSEYQEILGHALGRAVDFGMQEGLEAGHKHGVAGRSLSVVDAYNPEAARASYFDAVRALEDASFPLVDLLKSKKDAGMEDYEDPWITISWTDLLELDFISEAHLLQPCI
ncbi:hypothetical protein Tco_0986494, partial [Tanacetum coccineum]